MSANRHGWDCILTNNKPFSIIAFDVNETLLDITTLEPLFERIFGNPAIMREWFAELILYSQTMTLSGLYTPFGELGAGVLRMVGSNNHVSVTDADVGEMKAMFGRMPAYDDVAPALTRLRDAGFRLVTLTNSAGASSPTPLEHAGLSGFFEQSFSVESVQKFKPAPEVYRHMANKMGVDMSDICLVACHLWDTIGAQAVGCSGAFITRPHNTFLPGANLPVPNFTAPDLMAFADEVISLRTV